MPFPPLRTTRRSAARMVIGACSLALLTACAGMGGRTVSSRDGATDGEGLSASDGVLWPTPADARRADWPDAASTQLIVVLTPNWNAPNGRLARFERGPGGAWRAVGGSFDVSVGRSGSGWGLGIHPPQATGPRKQEGDGRAPAGVFAIGPAFGYAASATTRLPYLPMQREHWCIDVPGSPLYNRIVDAKAVGAKVIEGSTEPMRRDLHKNGDGRYAQGFVIAHNVEGANRGGSCIFAHVWEGRGVPTAGCTAMSEADMATLLAWIDPARTPRFVLLPVSEYARLQASWDLPAPSAAVSGAAASGRGG